MDLDAFWNWLEYSPVGDFVATSAWAFPTLESVHVIGLALVVGSIAIMDLRLLGLASKKIPVTRLSRDVLPWTWVAFAIAAITGLLLFTGNASSYAANPFFQWKMVLLVLAALNMLAFHLITWKSVGRWDLGATPIGAKLAGGLSLVFWIAVVTTGRWIGFTLGSFYF